MAKRELEKPGKMTGQSWLDMIGGGGNTGIQIVGTDPSFSGGGESIGPMSLIGGSSGAPTGGSSMFGVNFNFGLGETFDDALTSILEFLNIRLSGGNIAKEDGEQGRLFKQILDALKGVDSGETSIEDFLSSVSGLIPNDTVLENITNTAARVQYEGFLRRFGEAGEDADKLQSVISQYENAGIQNNSIVQSFAPAQTSGEEILKEIFGESGATIGAGVTISIEGIGAILSGQVSFEDFVREIFILTKGILNLPIPDWLPIPAVFKLPTIGEIWDKTFGGIIGDVQDSGCLDEENAVAECAGEIGDAVVGAVGDFGKTVEGKITEVYEGIVGAVKNPEDAIQQVYDWLKGIFGEDPQNMPPWIWGVVLGGVFGKEILGGLEDIFGDDVNDDGTIGVPPVPPVYGPENPNPDCVAAGAVTDENGNCVCPEGSEYIEASKSCEPTGPVVNEVEEDCKLKGREYNEVTDSCGDCKLDTHQPDDITGECVEVTPDTSGTDDGIDCSQPQPGYTPSFNPADNAAHFEWQEACGATHCPDGSEKPASGICGEQPQPTCNNGAVNAPDCNDCGDNTSPDMHEGGDCNQPLKPPQPQPTCNNGAINAPDCNDCGDNSTPDMHEGGDCNQPLKKQQPQPCPNGATLESDCTKCPEGQDFNSVGKCAPKEITPQPPSQGFNLNVDCSNPKIGFTPSFDYAYNAAYSEYSAQYDEQCGGGGGSFNCNSLNRQTREDGSCGECLPGYVLDQNMDNCVKQEVPVTPTETPTETPATGGGASVGGGAGGAFSPFLAGITYTPQPVPEIIQQQSGMFTGAQPTRNTQLVGDSIIKNIFKEYFV